MWYIVYDPLTILDTNSKLRQRALLVFGNLLAGPLSSRAQVHRNGGPVHIEPVSRGPRCECHGLGRAGPTNLKIS